MKRLTIAVLLTACLSAWGQATYDSNVPNTGTNLPSKTVGIGSYVGDLQDALVNTGHIEPWTTCHHIEIELDGRWGYAKGPDGTERKADGSWAFTYSILKLNVLDLAFDLADVDEDSVKTWNLYTPDKDLERALNVSGKQGLENLANVPLVMFETKTLNGVSVTSLDLDKLQTTGGSSHLSRAELEEMLGATTRRSKLGEIRFEDRPHRDAFKTALQKAAIVCRAQQ
jgi:hypothetical protein